MEYFNLQDNNLTGGIPEAINDLQKLVTLNLKNNKLGCYDYDFDQDTCLTHCDVTNECNGGIPSRIGELNNLQQIY